MNTRMIVLDPRQQRGRESFSAKPLSMCQDFFPKTTPDPVPTTQSEG